MYDRFTAHENWEKNSILLAHGSPFCESIMKEGHRKILENQIDCGYFGYGYYYTSNILYALFYDKVNSAGKENGERDLSRYKYVVISLVNIGKCNDIGENEVNWKEYYLGKTLVNYDSRRVCTTRGGLPVGNHPTYSGPVCEEYCIGDASRI